VLSESGEDLRAPERWELLFRNTYTVMLGRRLRRVREAAGLTQAEALKSVRRPNGRSYSVAFLSRIEAGYANSPLYAYLHLAEGYELDVARLLGPEEAEKPVGEAEMTLILLLRRLGITADEAIARLVAESR
jgi:transcriptional regulator with XRE-family HTH domain